MGLGGDDQVRSPPHARSLARWVRRRFERRSAPRTIAALTLVLLLPTVCSGLVVDDLFHRLVVEGKLGVPFGRLDLFGFISPDPATRARFSELGIYPWWLGPHTQVSYWRPAAALTHFVDYAL